MTPYATNIRNWALAVRKYYGDDRDLGRGQPISIDGYCAFYCGMVTDVSGVANILAADALAGQSTWNTVGGLAVSYDKSIRRYSFVSERRASVAMDDTDLYYAAMSLYRQMQYAECVFSNCGLDKRWNCPSGDV